MKRRTFLLASTTMLAPLAHASDTTATLYKDPACGCCGTYANYLRDAGIKVEVIATADFAERGRKAGVPQALEGCHCMFVGGYVISGHVPVEAVRKVLTERPSIAGLTLPGMPAGSPGMGGAKEESFRVISFDSSGSEPEIYMVI